VVWAACHGYLAVLPFVHRPGAIGSPHLDPVRLVVVPELDARSRSILDVSTSALETSAASASSLFGGVRVLTANVPTARALFRCAAASGRRAAAAAPSSNASRHRGAPGPSDCEPWPAVPGVLCAGALCPRYSSDGQRWLRPIGSGIPPGVQQTWRGNTLQPIDGITPEAPWPSSTCWKWFAMPSSALSPATSPPAVARTSQPWNDGPDPAVEKGLVLPTSAWAAGSVVTSPHFAEPASLLDGALETPGERLAFVRSPRNPRADLRGGAQIADDRDRKAPASACWRVCNKKSWKSEESPPPATPNRKKAIERPVKPYCMAGPQRNQRTTSEATPPFDRAKVATSVCACPLG